MPRRSRRRRPGQLVGEVCPGLRRQLADHGTGKRTATHVAQGRVIDHVIGVSGAQEIEKVQSALAGPRGEPGEAVVANLGAEAIRLAWRAPVSSTVIQAAVRRPARNTSRFSARKSS